MDLISCLLIVAGLMLFASIYLGVRDQYKSQEEIAKRNYELDRYYDTLAIGDIFESKIGHILFKVNGKKFKSVELEEIRFDGVVHKDIVNVERLLQDYNYYGNVNQGSIMF